MIGFGFGFGFSPLGALLNQKTFVERSLEQYTGKIIGVWPLDEASGTTAIDANATNNAAYSGTVTLNQAGVLEAKCVNFGGTGALNVYSAAIATAFNGKEGFVSFFAQANDLSVWAATFNLATFIADNNNKIFVRRTGLSIEAIYYGAATYKAVYASIPKSTKWFHVGVSWSWTTKDLCIYYNGVLCRKLNGITEFTGSISNSNANIFSGDYSQRRFNGKGQFVTLLNAPPTDQNVSDVYKPKGLFLFEGDSRTSQKGWHGIAAESADFNTDVAFGGYGICDKAESGSTVAQMAARASGANAMVLAGKTNVLVVWCGVNSVAVGAETIYNGIKDYCIAARVAGFTKIVVCTEIDAQANMTWHNTVWPALNILLAADHSFADAVADLGADAAFQNALDTTYYNADKIHLTDAGYTKVGEIVNTAINTLNLTS